MSVGISSPPFSGFRVDPEQFRVSAASVKVVGVTRPVCNHTFSPCLPYFSFSMIPTLLGQRFFSNHGMGGRRMLFLPMRCFIRLLKAPLVLWGPQCPWFSGASGSGSRRFGGSASGQGSVEPVSGAVTTSRSVRASSSYLVTIQLFIRSRFLQACGLTGA